MPAAVPGRVCFWVWIWARVRSRVGGRRRCGGGRAGLALAQLAAGLIAEPRSAPVVAVGAAFIDVIPASVREFGIRTLGTADKPVLVTGIVVLVVALGALAGLAGGWRRPLGWVVFGVLGLVGVLAAASRPDAGTAAVVPSVLAALAAGGILAWGLGAVERTPAGPFPEGPRRRGRPGSRLGRGGGTCCCGAGWWSPGRWPRLVRAHCCCAGGERWPTRGPRSRCRGHPPRPCPPEPTCASAT
ncbi:hypothetical protein [Actinopolymorpha cephalotaxi]|uniref:hypothetical protein n=1 Tax=Actinopolymorpha cephalotaxi TaxID=504797 RepID=UPI00363A1978